jgi:hypothetical protein
MPADLLSAVQKGSQQQALEALRDRLARSIEIAVGEVARSEQLEENADKAAAIGLGQIAGLSKQLRETLADLAKITPAGAADPVDELAEQRAARQADAAVRARPARKVVGGTGSDRPVRKSRAGSGAAPAARAPRSPRGKP